MKLSQKIAKLFDGSGMRSFTESVYRLTHPVSAAKVYAEMDLAGLEKLKQKYFVPGEETHWPKYVEAERWVPMNIRRAQFLRLNARPKPLRIFDIGSGGGYFLLTARALGHSGVGLDIAEPPMYQEMFDLFKLKRLTHRIQAYEPLPDLGERFDMVTGFSICFNAHNTKNVWGPKEWEFFMKDLKSRFLKPDGEIFFGMNPENDGTYYTPGLREFFISRGAEIDRTKVWFRSLDRI
jgi:SAM-dependent methyltransferase